MLTSLASTRTRTRRPGFSPVSRTHSVPPGKARLAKCHCRSRSCTTASSKAPASSPITPGPSRPANTSPTGPQALTLPASSTTSVSAKRTTSSEAWVTYSMGICSSSRKRSSQGKISCRRAWSMADRGSSSNSSLGCVANARAMATRCRSPPDNWSGRRRSSAPMPSSSIAASKPAASRARPERLSPNCKLPRTSRCSNRLASWNT